MPTVRQGQIYVNSTAWTPGEDIKCEEWLRHGERLGAIGRASAWWIGDWVNYGNSRFGEKYTRAARITGYDIQSLMNMAYVASRFPPRRRRAQLSWSHHAEVAALEAADQERWLQHAEDDGLSVQGFREVRRLERRRKAELSSERRASAESVPDGSTKCSVCPNCGFEIGKGRNSRKLA